MVKLDSGRIYTDVQHDGNPFIVDTANGQAVITGTTFDIRATKDSTTLVVSEGTVRFENSKGYVNVTAGHKSFSDSGTAPSLPVKCDTGKLTAWAMGLDDSQQAAAVTAYQPEIDLPLIFDSEPLDLEQIDYDSWIKQKRNWFRRQFPQIFRFKEALTKEGIEVDYPELLIKSGEIWQFAFPEET